MGSKLPGEIPDYTLDPRVQIGQERPLDESGLSIKCGDAMASPRNVSLRFGDRSKKM
jgi:hypothetical protein